MPQFERRSKAPRAGDLDLERAHEALEMFFEDVEIAPERAARPAFFGTGVGSEAPARRLHVDVQADQVGGAAPDHVGAYPDCRQLGKVREPLELAGHDAHCLVRVDTRQ